MEIEIVCYATLRDAVGTKTLHREIASDATVSGVLESLSDDHEDLGPLLFDTDGTLRPNVNVLVNDENVRLGDGGETVLADGDTVSLAPGVSGGRRTEQGSGSGRSIRLEARQ